MPPVLPCPTHTPRAVVITAATGRADVAHEPCLRSATPRAAPYEVVSLVFYRHLKRAIGVHSLIGTAGDNAPSRTRTKDHHVDVWRLFFPCISGTVGGYSGSTHCRRRSTSTSYKVVYFHTGVVSRRGRRSARCSSRAALFGCFC